MSDYKQLASIYGENVHARATNKTVVTENTDSPTCKCCGHEIGPDGCGCPADCPHCGGKGLAEGGCGAHKESYEDGNIDAYINAIGAYLQNIDEHLDGDPNNSKLLGLKKKLTEVLARVETQSFDGLDTETQNYIIELGKSLLDDQKRLSEDRSDDSEAIANMRKNLEDLKTLYDNPDEDFAVKNYGSVEKYKKLLRAKIEELSGQLKLKHGVTYPVYLESSKKNIEKNVTGGINSYKKDYKVMTEDKSIFDKLFEQVMEDADDEALELGLDLPGEDEPGLGAEVDGEVTVTLKPEQVELLKDILAQVDGEEASEEPEEGEEEGEGEEAPEFEEEALEEENKATTDGKVTGVDPSNGGGGTSEPATDSLGGKSSGTGDAGATDKEGTEETKDGQKTGEDPSGLSKGGLKV